MSASAVALRPARPRVDLLFATVQAVIVLNLIDAAATLLWVNLGIAVEANVLLSDLVETNAAAFMAVKLSLVCLGVTLLWRLRQRPLAVAGLVVAFLIYATLLFYHVGIAALTASRFV